MTTKAADKAEKKVAATPAFDFGRFAASPEQEATSGLHPMMTNPAAAIAAAAAIGIGFTTQVTGAFFGALQSALVASRQLSGVPDESDSVAAPAPGPSLSDAVDSGDARQPAAKAAMPSAAVKARDAAPVARKSKPSQRKADDLKTISGIGPKLEKVLNEMGIRRFAEIAAWSDDDVRRIDDELGFGGRISRDDWVGQAKALAK